MISWPIAPVLFPPSYLFPTLKVSVSYSISYEETNAKISIIIHEKNICGCYKHFRPFAKVH